MKAWIETMKCKKCKKRLSHIYILENDKGIVAEWGTCHKCCEENIIFHQEKAGSVVKGLVKND